MSLHCILFLHCLGSLAGIISLKKEFLQELWGGHCELEHIGLFPEVVESTISALVQTNFLVSFFAEVDAIAKLALTAEQLQSMAISVAISCLSAGLSFAGRDKSDGIVLSLPGKVGWGPTMGCLVLVRAMEVASRMVAFNIIQLSMRGGWCGHVGGPLAVFVFVVASRLCFAEAKLVDVLVPRICGKSGRHFNRRIGKLLVCRSCSVPNKIL